jgi:hypothetical protein
MIDVRIITTDQPNLILPHGIRWIYVSRCTRPCIVRNSEGGQVVATIPRNGRGDVMVPEAFTALHFEFQERVTDTNTGIESQLTIFLSDSPIRANILGDVYYHPDSNKLYEPYAGFTGDDNFIVNGTELFVPDPASDKVNPLIPGRGAPTDDTRYFAGVTSSRRARTYFLHNSQSGFPFAMLVNVAGATRLPIVEMNFVPVPNPGFKTEFFVHDVSVEVFGVTAAGQIVFDLTYEPAGYIFTNGVAGCSVIETDDLPYDRSFDPGIGSSFQRSTNAANVCPYDGSKIVARRVIDVPINYSGKIDLISALTNESGRQSPVQPIAIADGVTAQNKLIVVAHTSVAMQFRVLVTARFSISDTADEMGYVWT